MLLSTIEHPVSVLNLNEFDISLTEIQLTLAKHYSNYGWDNYLLQQNKIAILKSAMNESQYAAVSQSIWLDLYQNNIKDADIPKFLPFIQESTLKDIELLKPNRQRCISEYILEFKDLNWSINRIPSLPFLQKSAIPFDKNVFDYRLTARVFKDLPDELVDDNLKALLKIVAYKTSVARPNCKKLNIVVHHTLVWCNAEKFGDNSPEGIHQDGVDFIVSALCIERHNIIGAKSIIYGADKSTPLFEIELQAGQGIFQPDAGSDLWHKVTPFRVKDASQSGFRSTIGFDIMVLE